MASSLGGERIKRADIPAWANVKVKAVSSYQNTAAAKIYIDCNLFCIVLAQERRLLWRQLLQNGRSSQPAAPQDKGEEEESAWR
jgi:hypothetical protein